MKKAAAFAAAFFVIRHRSYVIRLWRKFAKANFMMYNKVIPRREEVAYVCPLSIP